MQANIHKVDYAIISAMPEELLFILEQFSELKAITIQKQNLTFKIYDYHDHKILVTHSGIGLTFAASLLTLVDVYFNPTYTLISGVAGAVKDGLKLRDVVVAENAFEAEMHAIAKVVEGTPFETCLLHPIKNKYFPTVYPADPELLAIVDSLKLEQDIYKGTVVSSDAFPAPLALYKNIRSVDPYSIDMETSAFYQTAWLLDMKVLAVRGISNVLKSDGTDDEIRQSDLKGSAERAAGILLRILDKSISESEN